MGDPGGARNLDAPRRVRPRGHPRRRGDRHARPLPLSGPATGGTPRRVTLYHARGCSLCERARAVLERVRADVPFALEEVDITGVDELEQRHREWLPVVEIDGERAFVYHVDEGGLRRRLARG